MNPIIDEAKVDMPHRKKYEGVVMFPTTHDITEANIGQYMCVLKKLLAAGNEVLIVSKPRWACIPLICEGCKDYRNQILFRFTIGSTNEKVLKFWDRNAPKFEERIGCLIYAWKAGFQTSVSCEPYLDAFPHYVYEACEDYVTDKIWIGLLRKWESRVVLDDASVNDFEDFVIPLQLAQRVEIVRGIYNELKDKDKIMWKDSVREVLGL
jgi:hypothetical protein